MAKAKTKRVNYYRGLLQWAILLLLAYMLIKPLFNKSYMSIRIH